MIHEDLELPDGWRLETLATTVALAKVKVDPTKSPDVPYIGLEHVEANTMRILGHGRGSDVKSAKTKFSAGNVLYGKLRPYLNKVARPDFDGICSTDFLVFTESPRLDPAYLANYLNQLWVADQAHQLSNGVELPRVDWPSLSKLPIAFPEDKSTQRRIADRLALIRSSRSSATNHLRSARRSIERFRQAILIAAFSGSLTSSWRDTRPNEMSAYLDRLAETRGAVRHGARSAHVQEPIDTSSFPETPETWAWLTADSACSQITDGEHIQPPYQPTGYPMLSAKHVRDGFVDPEGAGLISKTDLAKALARCAPKHGDLLVVSVGATTGRSAIVEDSEPFAIVRSVLLLKPLIDPKFLLRWLQHPWAFLWMTQASGASAQPHLYIKDMKRLPVPIPPLTEQLEIVRKVDESLQIAAAVASKIESADDRIARSLESFLTQACRGVALNGDRMAKV